RNLNLLSLLSCYFSSQEMFRRSIVSNYINVRSFWNMENDVYNNFLLAIFFKRKISDNVVRLYTLCTNGHIVHETNSIITNAVLFNILYICMMQYFNIIFQKPISDIGLNFRIESPENRPASI